MVDITPPKIKDDILIIELTYPDGSHVKIEGTQKRVIDIVGALKK